MLYGLRQASTVLIVGVVLLDTYYLPQEDPILAIIVLYISTIKNTIQIFAKVGSSRARQIGR